ncbi:MAG: protein phosphatase 2C domain-containing protein [Bacteroidales bacterium]|nr:protein phosphatase 2C domain-containing protein [Bacteroidales bacterium]
MPAFIEVRVAALTDVGVKRSHNQDACTAQPATDASHYQTHGHIFVVADGMGGHAVGEKASAKAIRDIPLTFIKHVAVDGVPGAIRRSFKEANESIYQIGQNNPEFKGLGTTATALFLHPEGAWLGHVGDSRAYRVRGQRVQQLTFDHSWVWEVARRQGIDPDELGDFKRNVIIRSMGPDAELEVDVEGPHPVEPGDQFLLCSDGLSNMITPDEIGMVLATFPPDQAAKFLVDLANARGGPDNITCLIVSVPGENPADNPKNKQRSNRKVLASAAQAVKRWNKMVPWPLSALGGAVLCAGFSVSLRLLEFPGSILFFLIAACLIIAGLIGLILQARESSELTENPDDSPLELRLYRDYPFVLDGNAVSRLTVFETKLQQEVNQQSVAVDWAVHERYVAEVEAHASKGEWAAAFRARCLAVQTLAIPFNKHRQKDEAFKPNWTPKAAGG